jgi:hypothetical protein
MAYARFSHDSDVYVFHSFHGTFECAGCSLTKSGDRGFVTTVAAEMLRHMEQHIEAGELVPSTAIERLCEEGETVTP